MPKRASALSGAPVPAQGGGRDRWGRQHRLTAIKALLAALGQDDLSAAQRAALERIGMELDRATVATADLHRQVSSSAGTPSRPSVTALRPHTVRPGVLLVVDSDDTIRDVLGQLFRAAGHRVIPARDGVEAFAILQQEPVDCVISETRVDRLSGEGLYAQVEQRLPHLTRRFVFVSGDTQRPEVRDFLERSGRPVLPKPFDVEMLAEAVNRVRRAWVAIREDELAASCMGINVTRAKLAAFAVSAAIGGAAGACYSGWFHFLHPDMFKFWESILILCLIVLGGMGSIPGVILGAGLLILLTELLRAGLSTLVEWAGRSGADWVSPDIVNARYLIFGLMLVVMMRFRPEGLFPSSRVAAELHPASESDRDHE